jgi:hypothetical protein
VIGLLTRGGAVVLEFMAKVKEGISLPLRIVFEQLF